MWRLKSRNSSISGYGQDFILIPEAEWNFLATPLAGKHNPLTANTCLTKTKHPGGIKSKIAVTHGTLLRNLFRSVDNMLTA
jgi:hypothetical protein